ncbi:peptidoglycan-binding protein [Streptomyces caelestis]|uniref:Peptidoglycan binding-like domain-containing protein n=1 Tax=Streptomyces caelestis TaxID=36816 RepID=A0A7W9H346_9ACTN|nr:peptidoglycan-binding protein [Streptomyces caelestis]MBB5794466.1 hypothetical protein [Streptomyces caelestis]GGW30552.1 peptidoglycan-binding protein [Streptomyces caelestis]
MEQPNGNPCPECGTPRQPDNTPSCTCAHRTADALRDARTTEAAAAADFDPLRIRPYVELTPDPPARSPENEGTPGRPSANGPAKPPHAEVLHAEAPAQAGEGALRQTQADRPAASPHADSSHVHAPGRTTDDAPRRSPGRAADGTPSPSRNLPAEPPRTDGPPPAAEGAPRRPLTNPGQASGTEGAAPPPSPADATMPLRPVDPVDPDATTVLPVSPATSVLPAAAPAPSVLPTPLSPAATEPSVTDLRLFDGAGGPGRGVPEGDETDRRPRRRRRTALLATAAGACVAVVAAAGLASGLFSYEAPSRNSALPDDLRASVPDAPSSSAASTPPAGSAPATPSAPVAPPPAPSATGSPSASPSPSAPSASPSPSRSATPSAPLTSATATGPENGPPDSSRQISGPAVLRLGDRGPEVTELQFRLRQLYLYDEDTDGDYDSRLEDAVRTYQWSRGIQTDDLGVYDRETRAKLESETKEP